ncbi:Otu domain-containing protein [Thalictrum thalictroides]|uniref:Otu domain-containing protein n=1 Tax=Thalictrum thalictroides TaxID=46969 RepID=A0A7J6V222_THATH|nr:Otu domain-containing protein [Thalictrum thalictroides]
MVRKQQKPKSKKKPQGNNKRHGKSTDMGEFCSQLDILGLKIVQVTSDGNCFFRALADQLQGSEEEHQKYRNMVVQYILKQREDFEPFIEDGVPFDEYCKSMAEDGTWAGNMELQAASLVTRSNICIHRIMQPRWYIRNFPNHARIIHLSYHNEEHYNSVRLKEDPCNGPAKPIVIKVDADLSKSREAKGVSKSKGSVSECNTGSESIQMVMAGSGCKNVKKVEQVLQLVNGDVNEAIELLIAEKESIEYIGENDEDLIHLVHGHYGNGMCEWLEGTGENACEHNGHDRNDIKSIHDDKNSQHIDKNISRNKVCHCGSKKKYKACCGSTKGASSLEFPINQRVAHGKGRTQRKQNRKGGSTKVAPSGRVEENLPDMGALWTAGPVQHGMRIVKKGNISKVVTSISNFKFYFCLRNLVMFVVLYMVGDET